MIGNTNWSEWDGWESENEYNVGLNVMYLMGKKSWLISIFDAS